MKNILFIFFKLHWPSLHRFIGPFIFLSLQTAHSYPLVTFLLNLAFFFLLTYKRFPELKGLEIHSFFYTWWNFFPEYHFLFPHCIFQDIEILQSKFKQSNVLLSSQLVSKIIITWVMDELCPPSNSYIKVLAASVMVQWRCSLWEINSDKVIGRGLMMELAPL